MQEIYIFDLDGTLYEKSNPITEIIDKNIEKYIMQHAHITSNEYYALEIQIPDLLAALKILEIDKNDFYSNIYKNIVYGQYIHPDIKLKEMLNELNGQKIICTNSSKEHTINILKSLNIQNSFHEIYSNEDFNCKKDIYTMVIDKYKILPSNVFVIGDDYDVDLKPAELLNCNVIHVNEKSNVKNCYDAIKIINKEKRNKMEEHFINPETMDISDFLSDIKLLHEKVDKKTIHSFSRIPKNTNKKYAQILEDENLDFSSKSIDEVYERLANYTEGMVLWNNPGTLTNVNPVPTIESLAAGSYFSLYNPNAAQDLSCGLLMTTELATVKMISQLAGIDYKKSGGIFTFGGKSTNMHAVKHGLQRINSDYRKNGIKDDIVVFSNKQGHVCHVEVCGWLGIGENNCKRIKTDSMGRVDLEELEKELDLALSSGKKVATIIINGCTTIQMTIDPIKKIVKLRDKMVKKYNLSYIPRVHVDSVIGWVWLFFKDYDFKANPLKISNKALAKIERLYKQIKDIKYADSFGVDFHKTGFCSYLSSLYITKDKQELYNQGDAPNIPYDELEFGNYSPFQYTLELSRSLNGPISAYVNMKMLGIEGYQKIMANLMDSAQYLKERLQATNKFEVINDLDSDGFVTLFVAKENSDVPSFFDLGKGDLEYAKKFGEYNHKFYTYLLEKEKQGLCSFTIDYSSGYHILSNGKKIGVLKAYPMSAHFNREYVDKFIDELLMHINNFDKIKDSFVAKEVPHKPRPFVFR